MRPQHFKAQVAAKGKGRIEIYSEIGPAWAGMVDEQTIAQALKELGDVSEVDVRVNSLGGDAYDGLAICNMFKAHPAKFHGHVEGIAASAATLLLMGCDTVTVPKNALFMIHDPSTIAWGDEETMRRASEQLKAGKAAGVETYAAKNKKKTKEEIAALMKEETWYTGEEAVEAGFADRTEAEVQLPTVEPTATVQNRFRKAPSNLASFLSISMSAKGIPMPDSTTVPPIVPAAAPPAPAPATPAATQAVPAPAVPTTPAPTVPVAPVTQTETPEQVERRRCADITALCNQVGKPELAADFIDKGNAVQDVQNHLFRVMCNERKPIDGGGTPTPPPADPNAKYKQEYAADAAYFQKTGTTEEDYVLSRRISEGVEPLIPARKV